MQTHVVPVGQFDDLARGEGCIGDALGGGQRSKRLLLLHLLLDRVEERAPDLYAEADVGHTRLVLLEAHTHARDAVDAVLLQPHVGAWATTCLRHVETGRRLLPEDFGYLGGLAAAAALRAGLPFAITGHLRSGALMLPTFGSLEVPRATGWCRLRSRPGGGGLDVVLADGTELTVSFDEQAVAAAQWRPLRRLRCSAPAAEIDIALDDLDPFRDGGALATAPRLDADRVRDWQGRLDEAWSLLTELDGDRALAIGREIVSIVPLTSEGGFELSASRHEAVGAIATTFPSDPLALALALVHEHQHTKLAALLDLVPLVRRDDSRRFHAPWRADPRPVRGLLHGIYAFLGLTVFWSQLRRRSPLRPREGPEQGPDEAWPHYEFAVGRAQVAQAISTLQGSGQLTGEGTRFVEGLRSRVDELLDEDVPASVAALAALAGRDNAVAWRLRNHRPDEEQLAAWAEAWVRGEPMPDPDARRRARLVDGHGPLPSDARAALLRRRVAYPHRWRDVAGASAADLRLIEDDDRPGDAYYAQIRQDPADLASWAGLALCPDVPEGTRRALATDPAHLYGLHRAITERSGVAPDVDELAGWMAGGRRPPGSDRV